ncbi:MAG: hypothetical protein ACLTDX_25155 [[Clostridium] innocuum]
MQSTTNGGKALDRAFSFLLWGNQEEERKSVHFCSINAKGMLIFIVADIWNCYQYGYEESDKFESVNNFQTASLHGNKKQTILKVGGGTNGK